MMGTKKSNEGILQFIIICIIAFTIFLSNQMVQNTVTKFGKTMMSSTQMLGFLGGMWGLASLLTRPFAGQVIDNENHKPLLFASVFILFLSNVLLIWANNIFFLLCSRAINGLAWGFGSTVCMTTACNALPKEKMAGGIGIYTLMQVFAQVLGPSLALVIIDHYSFHVLFMLTTGIMVIAFFMVFLFKTNFVPPEKRSYAFTIHKMFAPKAFIPASLLMSNIMQISAVAAFLLLYADSKGIMGLSFFFTIQAISIMVTRPIVSKYITERNSYAFTIVSELIIILGLLNLFITDTTFGFVISACLFGLGKSGSHPALMNMCISSVGKNERGRASNTSYAFQDFGQILGSNIAGFFAGIWGYAYAFLSVAVIVTAFTIFFIIAYMIPQLNALNVKTKEVTL